MRFLLSATWLLVATLSFLVKPTSADTKNLMEEVNNWMEKIRSLEDKQKVRKLNRLLRAPSRTCNEVIATVTVEEVFQIADIIVDVLIPPGSVSPILVTAFKSAVTNAMKYDFVAVKVCMSCKEVTPDMVGQNVFENNEEYGFASYCASNSYAEDAQYSALLFAPLNSQTETIVPGAFQGFVSAPSTRADLALSVTESWPRDLTAVLDGLQDNELSRGSFLFVYETFLAPVVAATAGAMTIIPDYLGYGQSYEYNRAFFTKIPYEQSIALSWLAAKRYLANSTRGCTILENAATAQGYGEGAYAIIPGAMALNSLGVEIHSAHAGATPISLVTQLDYVIELFKTSPNVTAEDILHQTLIPGLVFGYSQDLPFLETSGTGEKMVAEEWDNDLNEMYSAPLPFDRTELLSNLPSDPTKLIRDDFKALFEGALLGGVTTPFLDDPNANDGLTRLFQDVVDNGLTQTLQEVPFPLFLCHSPDDTVVTIDNLPDFPFENDNVEAYAPTIDLLAPEGSHSTGLLFCALDAGLKIQTSPQTTQITSLDNMEACLANPFPPTSPPIPIDQLTVEEYKGIKLDLVGVGELLDKGAFETLTELFVENFFNSNSDRGASHVESDVTVTDVLTKDSRRRLQTDSITVVFDMTLTYLATSDPLDREELAAAPFANDEQREKYVEALVDSEEPSFQTLQSVSAVEVPESKAVAISLVLTGLWCVVSTMLLS